MNIEDLRLKHKEFIVERAFNIYSPACRGDEEKDRWVRFLLSGNDIREMIRSLKEDSETYEVGKLESVEYAENSSSVGCMKVIDDDLECRSGDKKKVRVQILNNSDEVWQTTPEEPRFASYHWYSEAGEVYELDGLRTEIPRPIKPGGSLSFDLDVVHPVEPGNYFLVASMVFEGRFWMENIGLDTHRQFIEVKEYDGRGLTRQARAIYETLKSKATREFL